MVPPRSNGDSNAPLPLLVAIASASAATAATTILFLLLHKRQRHQTSSKQQQQQQQQQEWQQLRQQQHHDSEQHKEDLMRGLTRAQILSSRRAHLANNLSLSFSSSNSPLFSIPPEQSGPLCVLSGKDSYLHDHHDDGSMFLILDCVNNVAHVGHSHPKLALIAANQLNLINTNTRYLHPTRVRYAKKLLETFPVGSFLREEGKVFFVNSGSEANDLALRMARFYGGIRGGKEGGRGDPDLEEGSETRAGGKGGGGREGGREGGAMETIVLAGAYHGHTASLIDISPYKYEGKGGFDPPEYIHKISAPDVYRGKHRCLTRRKAARAAAGAALPGAHGGDGAAVSNADGAALARSRYGTHGAKDGTTAAASAIGKHYAEEVRQICLSLHLQNKRMGAFIAESVMGCGGQVVLPPSFLSHCYEYVRGVGGVCIADEVQVGFGRVGTHFWGFETQDVCPDIVTMGKPMGNGFPLGAVVARKEIADAFAGSGMEYFNTFGGSNLSCAIGEGVLDIIKEERLQENALKTGSYLKEQLRERLLLLWPSVIGDVRGLGLFLGVECIEGTEEEEEEEAVEEGDNKEGEDEGEDEVPIPSSEAAGWIAARAREGRVQLSVDGPSANVLKIKPPLCFGKEEADLLVATLERAVEEYTLMKRKTRGKEAGKSG